MKNFPLFAPARGIGLLFVWFTCAVFADVKLPALISDHMVLQAGEPVSIWGWAKPGEAVSVAIGAQNLASRADAAGKWSVTIGPLKAGAHLTLTVTAENKIVIRDVLAGEVWLGSGQSNMGFTVKEANHFAAEQTAADLPEIRMFTVVHNTSTNQLDDCKGSWQVCHSNTVGNFSAALYFFGREIHRRTKLPVGLINSSWGGTPIQPWMSLATLKTYPGYEALLEHKRKELDAWPARKAQLQVELANWEKTSAAAKAAHQPEPTKPWNPGPPDSGQYMPGQLYNAMIHPLISYRIRGAIWYQGEANAGGGAAGATDYTDLQSRMIAGWRQAWGLGDFPFYFVQLPNYANDSWAYFREGQANILKVSNTGMAVTIDIGEAGNIHPRNKQEAGRRLALIALANVYQQKVIFQGPQIFHSEAHGAEIKITFQHTDGGLVAHDGALKGFTVAGADQKWHAATARIEGEAVMVSSPAVPSPVAVRYDWAGNPDGNLYNGAGLPAMPFRTERWQ